MAPPSAWWRRGTARRSTRPGRPQSGPRSQRAALALFPNGSASPAGGVGRDTQVEPASLVRAGATRDPATHVESMPMTKPVVAETKVTDPGSKPAWPGRPGRHGGARRRGRRRCHGGRRGARGPPRARGRRTTRGLGGEELHDEAPRTSPDEHGPKCWQASSIRHQLHAEHRHTLGATQQGPKVLCHRPLPGFDMMEDVTRLTRLVSGPPSKVQRQCPGPALWWGWSGPHVRGINVGEEEDACEIGIEITFSQFDLGWCRCALHSHPEPTVSGHDPVERGPHVGRCGWGLNLESTEAFNSTFTGTNELR